MSSADFPLTTLLFGSVTFSATAQSGQISRGVCVCVCVCVCGGGYSIQRGSCQDAL